MLYIDHTLTHHMSYNFGIQFHKINKLNENVNYQLN